MFFSINALAILKVLKNKSKKDRKITKFMAGVVF